jgi:hypothetical protein
LQRLYRSIVPAIRLSLTGLFLYSLGAAATASGIVLPTTTTAHDRSVSAAAATQLLQTGTMVLAPKDTWLNTNKKNYSTATTLATYTWPDNEAANTILMKFDLSALPAGSVVTEAVLQLALVASDTAAGTYTVTAHKVLGKNPNIAKATGYTTDGVIAWTPNCCDNGAPLGQSDISPAYDSPAIDKVAGFKAWTITTMVQEWLLNPATNFGLLLDSDASKPRDRYRTFASVEHANASLRPFLRVTFAAADVTPPSVAITTPSAGGISGTVAVTATAADNVAVANVQFALNGTPVGAAQTASPYSFSLDTVNLSDGAHSLTAVARDTSGNATTSASVAVSVNNGTLFLSPADTYLNVDTNNYSTSEILATYTWPDNKVANAILMKFDLSSLPPGAVVQEAKLFLALVQSDLTLALTYNVSASKVLGRNPVIAQATGYTADGVTNWTPNACCHDGAPLAQSDISPPYAIEAVDKIPGFKSWTITTMLQEWLANPSTNFGLVLNSDTSQTGDHFRYFASTENPVATLRPFLRITFSQSGDATPPTVAITAPASGTVVSGAVTITADASDDTGVAGVQLHLNGAPLGGELSAPYALNWNSQGVANGGYTLTAVARDMAGNSTLSAPVNVTVSNDTTAPVITGVTPSGVTTTNATISWTTNEPSDSQVEYGPTTAYGSFSTLDGALAAAHSVTLSGLNAASQYHFRVRSRDAAGNLATSGDATFTTLDGAAPAVAVTSPASGATVSGTITIAANASDNVGVVGVQFKLDGANLGAEDASSPYSTSWNTTAVANGNHTLTATARDAAGNVTTATAITVAVSNAPPPPPPGSGIASLYPGDVGIENNANVVFVERFDEASLTSLFGRWTDVLNGSVMSIGNDAPAGSPVGKSLTIPWSAASSGGHLYRQLSQGVDDTLYVRYYVKHPAVNNYQHSGVWMGGYNPPLAWPNPQAGTKPTGGDRFSVSAEQNDANFDHYNYWMGMHQSNDGNYWGNHLLNNPGVQAAGDQWMCVEQMVKLNAPVTSSNGEHAIWINGVKVSHVGQGFPNGSWSGGIFTQNSSGSPFPGFQWRNNASLNLNWIWLQVYSTSGSGSFKYAHVVAAKSYIGCLASGGGAPDATPPTVALSAPASGATVSSTITVSSNASDNVGVAGVQFKLDGVNLGAEDTTAPYSVSWNTTSTSNGSHTLTAVARDAAGNSATSTAVPVTVSNTAPPPSGLWPNEPSGFTVIEETGWESGSLGAWYRIHQSGDKPINVGSITNSIIGESKTLQLDYPAGHGGGGGTELRYDIASQDRRNEIYVAYYVQVNPQWQGHDSAINKMVYLHDGGAQFAAMWYEMFGSDASPLGLYVVNQSGSGPAGMHENANAITFTRGQWHRVEIYQKQGASQNGIVRVWVNGVLAIDRSDVGTRSTPIDNVTISGIWGGIGDTKNQADYMRFDRIRISRPGS